MISAVINVEKQRLENAQADQEHRFNQGFLALVAREVNRGPLPVMNDNVKRDNPERMIETAVRRIVGPESEILERTSHVRGRRETMGEFYARTGLAKSQILHMSKSEIRQFVEVVSHNPQPRRPGQRISLPAEAPAPRCVEAPLPDVTVKYETSNPESV